MIFQNPPGHGIELKIILNMQDSLMKTNQVMEVFRMFPDFIFEKIHPREFPAWVLSFYLLMD